jgi:hypothetical protein
MDYYSTERITSQKGGFYINVATTLLRSSENVWTSNIQIELDVVARFCNPNPQGTEAGGLGYIVSSRPAWTIQEDPVSEKTKTTKCNKLSNIQINPRLEVGRIIW